MSPEEHSLMLYLFDAITAAPSRSYQFLTMAHRERASEKYKETLLKLSMLINEPDLLLAECVKIRKEMI